MRRGDFTGRTAAHTAARTCVDGSTGARTTRSALRGRLDNLLAARRSLAVAGSGLVRAEPAVRWGGRARLCHSPHDGGHGGAARACLDGIIGAHTTRSAALGQQNNSLAARRSLDVAGLGSDRAEPAMIRGE